VIDDPFGGTLPKARAALAYAERLHAGQRRGCDGGPFILHPLEVALALHASGEREELVAAGFLHDTIEKAGATRSSLRRCFGRPVAALVGAVTEDPSITGYGRRKAALREQAAAGGEEALTLFAADKLSKVRELRRFEITAPKRRLVHYESSLELLQAALPEHALVLELAAEFALVRAAVAVGG
jgi:(p)ppGpp synthase/HD superfamily hydrolase